MNELLVALPLVFLAALVRGYTGFGYAAIAIVGMNIYFSPQQSIPVVLALDVLCSLSLLKAALKDVDIATLKLLGLGSLLGIPVGFSLLLLLPAAWLKLLICLSVLAFAWALHKDWRPANAGSPKMAVGFGMASGMGTAGASVGGPMIVCYMLASPLKPQNQRATMILFFILTELISIAALFGQGLFGQQELRLVARLLLPTLVGVMLGHYLFARRPPESFKQVALPVMVAVAVIGLLAALRQL